MASLPIHSLGALGMILFMILSLFTSCGSAVLITTFTDCLPDDVQQSPTHLQFHPLAVDATLTLDSKPYMLNMTIYGNVTGSSSLNPAGITTKRLLRRGESYGGMIMHRHWRRDMDTLEEEYEVMVDEEQIYGSNNLVRREAITYQTTGEIKDVDDWKTDRATTLKSQANAFTFQLVNGYLRFCATASVCPMKTTFTPPYVTVPLLCSLVGSQLILYDPVEQIYRIQISCHPLM